ncbi:MFS transporter [Steroidobacter sp.]|uniref:MFS transporter n=1 Tax=Steroidobacter sp. TaxID=1978227 RepID=UPI001A4162CC|nr:MFS transporter [Steroidobacter sp.]MBL8266854.1 MFS transporter [Steroidobacter sp.]
MSNFRWVIVLLLFAATAISYVDRQVLTVLAPQLRDQLQISNTGYASILTAFLLAYTFMQPITGWLIDRIGTRKGFALIMGWWSIAAVLHAFGNSVASFAVCRFLLGAGEAGSWAACVKAVSEWFPRKERGFATGLWSAGVSAGLVISVPIVAWINLALGWRWAFILTGLVGLIWLAAWLWLYRLPSAHPAVSAEELRHITEDGAIDDQPTKKTPYLSLLRSRNVWAVIAARVLADPWVWFYYFWIPEYLTRNAGFTAADIGKYAWIPFAAQGVGIVFGGALSDLLCRRGMSVLNARLTVMLSGMLLMTAGITAAFDFGIVVIFTGISTAMLGFGLWAPNMMSLCADAFPRDSVGSVVGLSGMGAGVGGMVVTMLTGVALDLYGYAPVFVAAGVIPLLAFVVLFTLLQRPKAATNNSVQAQPT